MACLYQDECLVQKFDAINTNKNICIPSIQQFYREVFKSLFHNAVNKTRPTNTMHTFDHMPKTAVT